MTIKPDEIGSDDGAARRVLVLARTIAPCLDSLPEDSDRRKDAIAILKNVYEEVLTRGARHVRSEGVASARVSYEVGSAFTDDDRASLRALCGAMPPLQASAEAPAGSFPKERPVGRVWTETY